MSKPSKKKEKNLIMTDQNRSGEEIDIFYLLDIIIKKKVLVISSFLAAILSAGFYCYLLRPDVVPLYYLKMEIRCPDRTDMLPAPDGDPNKIPNLSTLASSWFSAGAYLGAIQEQFHLTKAPEIRFGSASNKLKLLNLGMTYTDVGEGKRILIAVRELLKSSQTLQNVIIKEKEAIAAEIKKETVTLNRLGDEIVRTQGTADDVRKTLKAEDPFSVEPELFLSHIPNLPISVRTDFEKDIKHLRTRLRQQQLRLALSLKTHHSLLGRLQLERESRKSRVDRLHHMIITLEKTFDSEGPIYSDLILTDRTANYQIIGVTGIVGIFLGIFIVFLSEVKKRTINNREQSTV
jgi:hypothetical protein